MPPARLPLAFVAVFGRSPLLAATVLLGVTFINAAASVLMWWMTLEMVRPGT